MACSSNRDPMSPRFYQCLDGLREEFELLMTELDSMKKQKAELEVMIKSQRQELERIQQSIARLISESHRPRTVIPCEQSILPPSLSTVTPLRVGSQDVSNPTTPVTSDADTTHSHYISSPSSMTSISVGGPDLGPGGRDWSITFNKEAERELDLEIAYTSFHDESIYCVRFSQDGNHLAAGCDDGKAYIYDVETGALTCVLGNLLEELKHTTAVCFSCDQKFLATGSSEGDIYIWEINARYMRNAFKAHTDSICSLDFSSNSRLLVSASYDNSIRLWNMRYGVAKVLAGESLSSNFDADYCGYSSASFSPDGRYVAATHEDGMVRIWDVRTGQLMRSVTHGDSAYDIAFMPDGKGLVTGGFGNTLIYWDVSSWSTAPFRTRSRKANDFRLEKEFSGQTSTGSVYFLAISHDGRWIASGSADRSFHIWDSRNAVMQCSLNDHQCNVYTVDFSPAGCYLASGGYDGSISIWRYSSRGGST